MRGSQRGGQGTSSPIPWCTPYSQQPDVCNKVGKSEWKDTRKKLLFYGNHRSSSNHFTKMLPSTLLHLNLNGQSRIRHMRNMITWKKNIKMTSEETDNSKKLFIYLFGQAGSQLWQWDILAVAYELFVELVESSSLTRDGTQATCIGSMESQPLDHQRITKQRLLKIEKI